jgi:hypothetical protein
MTKKEERRIKSKISTEGANIVWVVNIGVSLEGRKNMVVAYLIEDLANIIQYISTP